MNALQATGNAQSLKDFLIPFGSGHQFIGVTSWLLRSLVQDRCQELFMCRGQCLAALFESLVDLNHFLFKFSDGGSSSQVLAMASVRLTKD